MYLKNYIKNKILTQSLAELKKIKKKIEENC